MKTMTMNELSAFLGKSNTTIYRHAKDCGITAINGKTTRLDESQVRKITERVFKRVPLAVQTSIRDTFSNDKGLPMPNEKVENEYIKRGMDLVFGAIGKLDERLSKIESCIEERQLLLPAPDISPRAHINEIMRAYAKRHNVPHGTLYPELYRKFYYAYSINITASASHRNMRPLDYVEQEGLVEKLEAVAIKYFASKSA